MTLADFETHVNDPAPAFLCYACGDQTETPAHLARVRNIVCAPAVPEELLELEAILAGQQPDILEFYRRHNGLILYEDTLSDAAGVELFPIGEWRSRTEEMRKGFAEMGMDASEDPEDPLNGITFGEVPHSANCFTLHTTGRCSGAVFYVDHDDWRDEPIAASFSGFLAQVLRDPADFLYRLGCYTRYSDGTTGTQWIPKQYVPDAQVIAM